MTLLGVIDKTDEDVRAFDTDFARWLASTDSLTGATAAISDSTEDTTTIVVTSPAVSGTLVKVTLSGGVAGEAAMLKILATTANAETKEINYRVRITER